MQRALYGLRTQLVYRTFATSARSGAVRLAAARPTFITAVPSQARTERRWLQSGNAWTSNRNISYDELLPITQQPNDDVLLIDVREPDEVMMGSIPSAVNIPLSNFEKALSLDGGDFQKTYGFRKPQQNQKIIVYCKAGKRSGTALGLAKGQGYSNVRNYAGSWLDWTAHQSKDSD